MKAAFGVLALAFVAAGCPEDVTECATGADCPSGACRSDGTCVPGAGGDDADTSSEGGLDAAITPDGAGEPDVSSGADAADAGPGDSGAPGPDTAPTPDVTGDAAGDVAADAGPDAADTSGVDVGPDAGGGLCAPNNDGVVTRDEMPIAAGLHATYRVATGATWSTLGKEVADGAREWDLTGVFPGEANVLVEARPLEGTWFEEDFPDASYAARLSELEDLLGVFRVTDDGLYLLGVVSMEPGFTETNLEYDPPVQVLQFPVEAGDTWATDSTVTGTALGVWSFYSEDYVSVVDAHGTMKTPFGDFPVLRVNVELTRTVGVLPTTSRTHMFIAECFGTVANVVSEDHEMEEEFEDVKELRRLAP